MSENDLTVVYYTANMLPEEFHNTTAKHLLMVTEDLPIISVSHKPVAIGKNIVVDLEYSYFNIYRQALLGAQEAKTKYIALVEDDELYSAEHFKYRPRKTAFGYNMCYWGIYTWRDNFHYKGRRNLGNLICDREAFIKAMVERFNKYPAPNKDDQHLKDIWAEPGKYENQLGVTQNPTENYYSNPPNIKFSHETELSFQGLGKRKRGGDLQAIELPYWGWHKAIRQLYV